MVAVLATYSMVALASPAAAAGELTISATGNDTPNVTVNGETAKSGRSIFSSSVISTPENASAVINLGKAGSIELAPNSTFAVSFDSSSISGSLTSGTLTVLGASAPVNVKTASGEMAKLNAGESASANGKKQADDDSHGGAAWWLWAVVFGGAAAGILIATTQGDNNIQLGGNAVTVSPTR
jgi:hypothetical protein